MVGTLDTLMSLSDELIRVDTMVENVVRKVSMYMSTSE
jgi:V-ATPase subunit C